MRDELPDKTEDLESGIMNLDVSSGYGTHWTCWFKSSVKGQSPQNQSKATKELLKPVCYYFDSFGLPPPLEFNNYIKCDIYHSTYQIQNLGDVICGHLCMLVLYMMTTGLEGPLGPCRGLMCNVPFHKILLQIIKDERKYFRFEQTS